MGRAEKYANVMDDVSKNNLSKKDLSITRELKFGELQKKIDDTVTIAEIEDLNDGLENSKKRNVKKDSKPVDSERKQSVKKNNSSKKEILKEEKVVKEKKIIDEPTGELIALEPEDDEDDGLFITGPIKTVKKKKVRFKKAFRIGFSVLVLLIVGIITYFKIFKPLYLDIINAKPQKVFENSIDYVNESLNKFIDKYVRDNVGVLYYDLTAKIDSNIEGFDELGNVYYGYKFAVDPTEKIFLEDIYLKNGSDIYSDLVLHDNGIYYQKISSYDKYMITGTDDDHKNDVDSFYQNIAETLKGESKEDIIYFIDKLSLYLKKSFKKEMFSRKDDELSINSKEIKVKCNTLELDNELINELDEEFANIALEDDRFIKIFDSIFDDDEIDETDKELIEEKFIINIYTKGFNNEFVGFDIIEDGFRAIYYYKSGNDFDLHINLTDDEDCIKGRDCVADNQFIIDVNGKDKDGNTEALVKYNNKRIANLLVRDISFEKIDFDYELYLDEESIEGDIYILFKDNASFADYSVSFRTKDNEYINLKGNIDYEAKKLEHIKKEDTIELSVKQENEKLAEFVNSFDSDTLYEKYAIWYTLMTDPGSLFEEEESANEA